MGATALDPAHPVLVGVAATSQRTDDPGDAVEAAALVARAVRDAAVDAGAPALVDRIEVVLVPEGTWSYPTSAGWWARRRPRAPRAGGDRGAAADAPHACRGGDRRR